MSLIQRQTIVADLRATPVGRTAADFLDYLTIEAGLSDNTVLAYGRDLRAFLEYRPEQRKTRLQAIGRRLEAEESVPSGLQPPASSLSSLVSDIRALAPPLICEYLGEMARRELSENSAKRALVAIRMFLRFAKLRGLIEDDGSEVLESPKVWQRLPIVCNRQQVLKLLQAPSPEEPFYLRDRAMLELLYATGMRASEMAGLKTSDLNLDIGYLRCFGKGNKERVVPVGKVAIAATLDYLRDLRPKLIKARSESFVLLSRTGRPLSRIEIWRLVKKYALRAGMPRRVTVHTLRHCFATHLLSGGADLRSVQEMLGHVDIGTTQIYTHVDHERLRSIHKKYHPRP
ncbi:MAG: site-specific tyrosine recombinase [Phycisphaerales bacterium]